MKLTVCGVKRIQGNAKATGNPFDMCHVNALVSVAPSRGKINVDGYGFEQAQMELAPEAIEQFSGMRFPCEVELKIEQRHMFGEFRSVVVGVEGAPAKLKAAV
jgi:hypothetical protein